MHDWRRHEREDCRQEIELSINHLLSNRIERMYFTAETVDISSGGIGVVVNRSIEPGFVKIEGIAGQDAGIVVWSRKTGDLKWRAGIQFVHSLTKLMRQNAVESDCGETVFGLVVSTNR
ncbi:MAG: hypothetical protein A2X56_01630 [Nitrospirae bacterium GWC2_57_13]|jgi:c-di-GMP-binding flagellar brake protein YcgR|nr:MAG: hypothetical protein A2072_01695 [Nitrospirae bacterium GWC1_57_7]OGW26582.1 MAG: hypothetical protein A2X56_01630 [Nitrospirae bacterium GWC2_57_13]OGW44109.1 MAG: hypothetical protein A2X57_07845 [Nitrospirae bacterium GWD2_57_8]HAR46401.1 hypothetical protein [Nitrospiraceae bacterium]